MLTYIFTPEELEKEAEKIQGFLDMSTGDDPVELVDRGNDLKEYLSRTGKMLADAKYHQDEKMKSEIMKQLAGTASGLGLSPSILKDLLKSACKNENYLVNWIERLNRTATHQLDWCRTLISKAKEEMKYCQ